MLNDPVLIGPIASGKSTVARILSGQLSVPVCHLDRLRWGYYKELGYDHSAATEIRDREGFWGLYKYWKPFEIHAVERVLQDHSDCIFDFGAGHSVYEDEGFLGRLETALSGYRNVILLLPSANPSESMAVLESRKGRMLDSARSVNEHLVRSNSNHRVAKFTVFNKGSTADQTASEILTLIKGDRAPL